MSELQSITDEDGILTSARYQFLHNYGNQYIFNVFSKQWVRLNLNTVENLRHVLGGSTFTAYSSG